MLTQCFIKKSCIGLIKICTMLILYNLPGVKETKALEKSKSIYLYLVLMVQWKRIVKI